jgi:hypothetical protein
MSFFARYRKFLVGNSVALASLVLASVFPTGDFFEGLAVSAVFLVVLPALFVRLVLGERLERYGLTWGDLGTNLLWLSVVSVSFSGVVAALFAYTSVFNGLSVPSGARADFVLFLSYVGAICAYLAFYEFFFRGFVQALWRTAVGRLDFLAQACILTVFLVAKNWDGSVGREILWYFLPALFAGFLAARTGSVLPSFLFLSLSVILGVVAIIVFG